MVCQQLLLTAIIQSLVKVLKVCGVGRCHNDDVKVRQGRTRSGFFYRAEIHTAGKTPRNTGGSGNNRQDFTWLGSDVSPKELQTTHAVLGNIRRPGTVGSSKRAAEIMITVSAAGRRKMPQL